MLAATTVEEEPAVRRAFALPAVVITLALLLVGCGGDDDDESSSDETPSGPTETIEAKDFSFDPSEVRLEAGKEVTLVLDNQGDVEHNLTVEDLDVDKDAEPGETANAPVTPDAGSYDFHCEYHPDRMQGTITVE
jgi:plastocyanin